jgi:hypothetical protein
MAWSALFQSADERADGTHVVIICTDGVQRITKEDTLPVANDATVAAFARKQIKSLEDQTAGKSGLTLTKGAVIDLTPPGPPVDPDPQLTAYQADLRKVQSMQRALDVGALPASSNATLAALKNTASSKWLDRFAGLV